MTEERFSIGGRNKLDGVAGALVAERGHLAGQYAPIVDEVGHLLKPRIIVSLEAGFAGALVENHKLALSADPRLSMYECHQAVGGDHAAGSC